MSPELYLITTTWPVGDITPPFLWINIIVAIFLNSSEFQQRIYFTDIDTVKVPSRYRYGTFEEEMQKIKVTEPKGRNIRSSNHCVRIMILIKKMSVMPCNFSSAYRQEEVWALSYVMTQCHKSAWTWSKLSRKIGGPLLGVESEFRAIRVPVFFHHSSKLDQN